MPLFIEILFPRLNLPCFTYKQARKLFPKIFFIQIRLCLSQEVKTLLVKTEEFAESNTR
jgi:hypothetical protein